MNVMMLLTLTLVEISLAADDGIGSNAIIFYLPLLFPMQQRKRVQCPSKVYPQMYWLAFILPCGGSQVTVREGVRWAGDALYLNV